MRINGEKKITKEGENFIMTLAKKESDSKSWVRGNNGKFPFSNVTDNNRVWISHSKGLGSDKLITNNIEAAQEMINYYNYYAKIYDLDPNILMAQIYQEGAFKIWIYNNGASSALGMVQFLNTTIFTNIIQNFPLSVKPLFTDDEINRLTYNLENGSELIGYELKNNNLIARRNREKLHQNFIDNVDLMIKAQFRFMKYLSNLSDGYASSSLFGYNRGFKYLKKTYEDTINSFRGDIKEGLDYVEYIFGYLADKNNETIKMSKKSNLKGLSFGYEKIIDLSEPYILRN